MNVFLSYGSTPDQVTALRLQALAAVNGLTAFVPPAYTRQSPSVQLDNDSQQELNEADVVLGVIGAGLSESCRQELNAGIELAKVTIVIAEPGIASQLTLPTSPSLIVIDPAKPEQAEMSLVRHLKSIKAEQSSKTALLALSTIALGLLILTHQD